MRPAGGNSTPQSGKPHSPHQPLFLSRFFSRRVGGVAKPLRVLRDRGTRRVRGRGGAPIIAHTVSSDGTIRGAVKGWGEMMIPLEVRHYRVRLHQSRRLRYRLLRRAISVSVEATHTASVVVRLAIATIRALATSSRAYFGNAKASVIDRLTKQRAI